MTVVVQTRFKLRRGEAAEWTAENPVLLLGEPGYETDTQKAKVGDGVTAWNALPYAFVSGGVTDGDKGDITISGGAVTYTIDPGAVTYSKIQNVSATNKILGRSSAGAGPVQEIDCTPAGRALIAAADAHAQRVLLRNACMVKKAATQSGANYTAATAIAWDSEVYDDGGWHDNSTNNSRMTVPAGVTRVRVGGAVRMANVTIGSPMTLTLTKGGSSSFDGAVSTDLNADTNIPRMLVVTGPVVVTPGDYFELQLTVGTDTSIDIDGARSNFWIEAC